MTLAAEGRHDVLMKLVQAILSFVKERDGYLTKTKLLKYLYLIDIEHYRETGQILTGFRWKFYKYGPWAAEYDPLYDELRKRGTVIVKPGTRPDLDTEFLETEEEVDLDSVFTNTRERMIVSQILDLWAASPLGEMLDYVYFHTEPMEEAKRDEYLSFEKIDRSAGLAPKRVPPRTPPPKSSISPLQRRLKQALAKRQATRVQPITPPRYDEVFHQGLSTLDNDTEY